MEKVSSFQEIYLLCYNVCGDYMDYLVNINKNICGNKFEIRDKECLKIINEFIEKFIVLEDENIILNSAMKISALIKLYQPFYDGNHRTALIVFGDLIVSKGYTFDYVSALNDMTNKKLNIPTIYSEEDKIGNFDKWFKYISKTEMKL